MLTRYEEFTAAISMIERSIQRIEHDEMIQYGFRGAYAQYLTALRRSHPEGLTAAQLSERCQRDKAAVSRIAAEMEAKGLIVRAGDGESAYRAPLRLTEAGVAAADFVCRRAQEAVEAVGGELTDTQRRDFYSALNLIAVNLQAVCRDGLPNHDVKEKHIDGGSDCD